MKRKMGVISIVLGFMCLISVVLWSTSAGANGYCEYTYNGCATTTGATTTGASTTLATTTTGATTTQATTTTEGTTTTTEKETTTTAPATTLVSCGLCGGQSGTTLAPTTTAAATTVAPTTAAPTTAATIAPEVIPPTVVEAPTEVAAVAESDTLPTTGFPVFPVVVIAVMMLVAGASLLRLDKKN